MHRSGRRVHCSGRSVHRSGRRVHRSGRRVHRSGRRVRRSGRRARRSGQCWHGHIHYEYGLVSLACNCTVKESCIQGVVIFHAP